MDEHETVINNSKTFPPIHSNDYLSRASSNRLLNELDSFCPVWYYELDPTINKLYDHDPTVRYQAIIELHSTKNRHFVSQLRHFQFDPAFMVRREVQNKLNPIESFYRRKFFYFQNMMKKNPNYAGYRFGLAIICLRYSQVWVQNSKLQDYFLREALRQLNRLIRTVDPKKNYFYYRGQVLKSMDRSSLAIEDFKKVLEIDSEHWGAILKLLDLYFKNKQPHKSFELVKAVRKNTHPKILKDLFSFWKL